MAPWDASAGSRFLPPPLLLVGSALTRRGVFYLRAPQKRQRVFS